MLNKLRILLLIALSALFTSCVSYEDKNDINEPGALDLILCEEPRPQICTREYNPVCGSLNNGRTKTGSTGCTSCSDSAVVGYTMGAC